MTQREESDAPDRDNGIARPCSGGTVAMLPGHISPLSDYKHKTVTVAMRIGLLL